MVTITDKTLKKISAEQRGDYLRIPISELPEKDEPESSNNGNYREYAEFWASTHEFRTSMSYHGDIEPFPPREKLSPALWELYLIQCTLQSTKIMEAEKNAVS